MCEIFFGWMERVRAKGGEIALRPLEFANTFCFQHFFVGFNKF